MGLPFQGVSPNAIMLICEESQVGSLSPSWRDRLSEDLVHHPWYVAKPHVSLMRPFQFHLCVLAAATHTKEGSHLLFVWIGVCCSRFLAICCEADFLESIWNGSDFLLPLCMSINSTWTPGGCFRDVNEIEKLINQGISRKLRERGNYGTQGCGEN